MSLKPTIEAINQLMEQVKITYSYSIILIKEYFKGEKYQSGKEFTTNFLQNSIDGRLRDVKTVITKQKYSVKKRFVRIATNFYNLISFNW